MGSTLVALAAGVGSRYGGLKQLEPIGPGGETLLEYSIFDALAAGFSDIVLVVQPETEPLFRHAFAGGMAERVPLSYVHQTLDALPPGIEPPADRMKPWGTGHAVLVARPEISGAFAVINADDFYGAGSFATMCRYLDQPSDGERLGLAMIGFELGQTLSDSGSVSRALCQLDADGYLERIVEVLEIWKQGDGGVYTDADGHRVEVPGDAVVSMNMWGFVPGLIEELGSRFDAFLRRDGLTRESEFLVPEVVQSLIEEGRAQVDVLSGAGRWCGITYPEDRQRVAGIIGSLIESGAYPEKLWS